jgi:transcriptional regulator with XRE-family HTH domain
MFGESARGTGSRAETSGEAAGAERGGARVGLEALGRRIQARRTQRGITLEAMATRTGFSKGYLSRIENGKKTPPLGTLDRIARALGTDINLLLGAEPTAAEPAPFVGIVRAGSRPPGGRVDGAERLTAADAPLRIEPWLLRPAREFGALPFRDHDGQQFLHVQRGRVECEIGGEHVSLGAGDSVYLDSRLRLRLRAPEADAEVMVVLVPRAIATGQNAMRERTPALESGR